MPLCFLRALCAALTVSVLFGLCAPVAAADSAKHIQVVQTFEPARNNGTPLVQVRFSNTVIGTFAIDTGEYESVVTEEFAKRAKLKLMAQSISLFSGSLHFQLAQASEIHLENLTITDPLFSVAPQNFLPPFNGRAIDGILGGDFLSQFAMRIDYPAHQMTWISPGNLSDSEAAALGFTPQNRVELGQERAVLDNFKINHYSLRADFQNKGHAASEDFFIDTGAPDTLISGTLAETLSLTPLSTETVQTLSEPETRVNRYSMDKVQIGQTVITGTSVLAPQHKNSTLPSLLGENILSDCVVLFDFGPHRFYLRPVLPPAKPEDPLDKTQIVWDRLRAAPDLPTVEETLAAGFVPDAQDTLAERAARLRGVLTDEEKDAERLEKLGVLLHEGEDEKGAKAAFAAAAAQAAAAAKAHPQDLTAAQRWVEALSEAEHYEDAAAAATQMTVQEPASAPGWRLLGSVLTAQTVSVLLGRREVLTEDNTLKIKQRLPGTPPDAAEAALLLHLLVQAHAALDKSVTLAPSDPDGYNTRAVFRLVNRASLSVLQEAGMRINLPASEVPSEEAALAEALADWQQCAALSPSDPARLSGAALVDQQVSFFHDHSWLTKHLKGTGCALPETLMTSETAQSRLTLITQSHDKAAAVAALTALGTVQAKDTKTQAAAEKSWRQALALDPAHSDALAALVTYLYHANRWKELQDLLTQQCSLCDTVPLRLTLASVLSGAGLSAEAEVQVRAAKALAPDNAAVNLTLAELLLARSSGSPAALSEASACLAKARLGYGTLATAPQKATLNTSEAVWLALDHDPAAAEKQLVALAKEQPTCTQVREALAALVPY